MALKIKNKDARQLWLFGQGLAGAPTGDLDVPKIIHDLGFVQLDTIQVVSRAHHHIIWSRNQNYREPMLHHHFAERRDFFEHFTHDASIIPMEFYPMWQRQFARKKAQIDDANWFKSMLNEKEREGIKTRIRNEGALSTHAFDTKVKAKKMWSRPPHKLALDYMWYAGELSTSHREGFTKFYDLAERIFPKHLREKKLSDEAQIDWLCFAALERIKLGTLGEIQKFWDAMSAVEVRAWAARHKDKILDIEVEGADGAWTKALALPDIEAQLKALPTPTSRLRILNPFDPAIRDRNRLERLFGFEYRNEMFVPAAKRKWGYYVFPILESGSFIGRIEIKADRKNDTLTVINIWHEDGVKWNAARAKKLDGELSRMMKFAGVKELVWESAAKSK